MKAPVLGGLLSGAGSVLGSAFGLMGQGAQNRANMRLAEYQHNKNVEMWKMQNEYNSPSAQMERYREAGLNPNLIYGSGTASAGNASSPPQYQAPNIQWDVGKLDFGSALSMYNDLRVKNAQIDNMSAQSNLANSKALTEGILASNLALKNQGLETSNIFAKEKLKDYTSLDRAMKTIKARQASNLEQNVYEVADANLRNLLQNLKIGNARVNNLEADTAVKQYEVNLNKLGVTKNDNPLLRMILEGLGKFGISKNLIPENNLFR